MVSKMDTILLCIIRLGSLNSKFSISDGLIDGYVDTLCSAIACNCSVVLFCIKRCLHFQAFYSDHQTFLIAVDIIH